MESVIGGLLFLLLLALAALAALEYWLWTDDDALSEETDEDLPPDC